MTLARALVAKSLQVGGLILVALGLVIGLRDGDMGRELAALALGSAIFVAGHALDPRDG